MGLNLVVKHESGADVNYWCIRRREYDDDAKIVNIELAGYLTKDICDAGFAPLYIRRESVLSVDPAVATAAANDRYAADVSKIDPNDPAAPSLENDAGARRDASISYVNNHAQDYTTAQTIDGCYAVVKTLQLWLTAKDA